MWLPHTATTRCRVACLVRGGIKDQTKCLVTKCVYIRGPAISTDTTTEHPIEYTSDIRPRLLRICQEKPTMATASPKLKLYTNHLCPCKLQIAGTTVVHLPVPLHTSSC